jgi:uncharacterized protein YyaL (SSP411 family)
MPETAKHTNRLINETSPYLLQHAHNPVDWYPWGDEAFARAAADDKPVLVSIGYSSCHWCHVMEKESFEDEQVATLMNEHFINIKVDMEERPDVDKIYMNFVQLTTGHGGWPMNVFLTHDKRPFYGGTYFPPAPRYGMPSWRQILMSIAEAYRDRRDELENSANEIVAELRKTAASGAGVEGLSTDLLDNAFESCSRTFDRVNGGFGGAPKFPPSMVLEFLLRYHHRTGETRALEMVTQTLSRMAGGGIYDQLGGGFHRYSVDAKWLVPHFEKMLYDNAQLIRVYVHAFQVTGDEDFRRVAVDTLEYVRREMLDPSGGFYSTQDADSEGEEGKFFVWTPEEIAEVIGSSDAAIFCSYYDVTPGGNFEGKNILNTNGGRPEEIDLAADELTKLLVRCRSQLFEARELRIKPSRDEKVLTAWNGLMMAAFAEAGAVLDNKEYIDIAQQNADFVLSELRKDDRLLRTWKSGEAKLNAYIEDHANIADGLIEVYRATGRPEYLLNARDLAERMITNFWDEDGGGFFFTSSDHEQLVVRTKDLFDNATPSGNSVAADVLLRLSRYFADDRYERFAVAVLRLSASQIRRYPQGFGRALSAVDLFLSAKREVVVAGPSGNDLSRWIYSTYLPNLVFAALPGAPAEEIPLLTGRTTDGMPAAYVCENHVCARPVTSVDELKDQLKEKAPSRRKVLSRTVLS